MENGASSEGKDPSTFLGEIIGSPVVVKLNSGVVYEGTALFLAPLPIWSLTDMAMYRRTSISRWLYEHSSGEDGRVCRRAAEAELWRCVCTRKQR